MRELINTYCATIGANPMLVQGAGGNISWKEKNILWVKASGTWLADANKKDIFVPVNLTHLEEALSQGDFSINPQIMPGANLRPSIETLLHALLPQPIVLHVHAIEILAHLVKKDFKNELTEKIGTQLNWVATGYYKPGAALAEAVRNAVKNSPTTNVVFLQNHGVVIGGANISEIDQTLNLLTHLLHTPPAEPTKIGVSGELILVSEGLIYKQIPDAHIQQLALNSLLYVQLDKNWALYPDHIVFLGDHSFLFSSTQGLVDFCKENSVAPKIAFIQNHGVYCSGDLSNAMLAQLRCYADILSRQTHSLRLNPLSRSQIAELVDWDAERYRKNIAQ